MPTTPSSASASASAWSLSTLPAAAGRSVLLATMIDGRLERPSEYLVVLVVLVVLV